MAIIIDSHCHPQFPQYDADRGEMIARAKSANIGMICVGTNLETSKCAVELANKHQGIWATVGIHPNDSGEGLSSNTVESFRLLLQEPKVVAVGEVGLDYYRVSEPEKQEQQKDLLKKFLELAVEYDKPVVLHVRDSAKGSSGKVHSDMIEILSKFYVLSSKSLSGVVHSFTGTVDEAKKYLNLGFYLGFNGIITFPPSRSSFVKTSENKNVTDGQVFGMYDEVVRTIPLERILLETDAPYLTPEPHRGKRNEPAFVTYVVDKIAEIKGVSRDQVIAQTTQNCMDLFGLK